MDDVRDQLISELGRWNCSNLMREGVADSILERFDVTPKPVISVEELGQVVAVAWHGVRRSEYVPAMSQPTRAELGQRMLAQLESRGLKIVRVSE